MTRQEAKQKLDELYFEVYDALRKEPLSQDVLEEKWNQIKSLEDIYFIL